MDPGLESMKLRKENIDARIEQMKVKEMMIEEQSWDLGPISELINAEEVKAIQAVQLPREAKPDKHIWPLSKNGEYKVKSGYY